MLIPWSAFWERNYFLEASSFLGQILKSYYTRGAITGLGLVNVWAALAELADMFGNPRHPSDEPDPNPQSPINNHQS